MTDEVKHSIEKARVAQAKARDPVTGKFLSGEMQAAVQSQQQQVQMSNERARLDQLFGRPAQQPMSPPPMVSQPMMQQNTIASNVPSQNTNFQAILEANKPGKFTTPEQDSDRWDTLLGKKRSNIRW